jgi:hypothetical protein
MESYSDLMGFNGDLMGINGILWGFHVIGIWPTSKMGIQSPNMMQKNVLVDTRKPCFSPTAEASGSQPR